jgi:diguanylate cyclase (GGDEF)-like protein
VSAPEGSQAAGGLPPTRRPLLVGGFLAAGLVLAVGLVLVLQPGGPWVALAVDDVTQTLAAAAAAISCGIGARRAGGRDRVVWVAMGLGCLSWSLGQGLWTWYELVLGREAPFPSAADVGFLGFPVGALVALWRYPTDGIRGARARRLLDGVTITTALGLLSWATALGAVAEAGADEPLAFAIGLAYPVTDLIVLCMAGIVLTRARGDRRSLVLIASGITSIAVADSAFSYLTTIDAYGTGGLESLGWTGGFALLALAPLAVDRAPQRLVHAADEAPPTSFLPYVPVAIALAVVCVELALGLHLDGVVIGLSIGVAVLVLARQYLTLRDNAQLVATLAQREAELRHQAFHDGLTGLANRALFHDRVSHALLLHARVRGSLAVLFCDLDDFKVVNDTLGHAAGDELLLRVAERMRGALRPGDTLARLGGDEFAVLLEDGGAPEVVGRRILQSLELPFVLGDQPVAVRASVGLASVTADAPTPTADALLAWADTAMYAAKRAGTGQLRAFAHGMELAEVAERGTRDALSAAIDARAITVHYQPLVDLASGDVVAVEALARWHDGERQVPPAEFVALAERSDLIGGLTDLVLDQVCMQIVAWDRAGRSDGLRVGVNVSPSQIVDRGFPEHLLRILARHGVDPRRLTLEITESALLADTAAAGEVTSRLSAAGIHLSLDDFGIGFSSLAHLSSVTLHSMKIDRAFIRRLDEGERHIRFVTALLRLGHDLGLSVIAEGVEDVSQLICLRALGCTTAQGYLFGRPGPPEQIAETAALFGTRA